MPENFIFYLSLFAAYLLGTIPSGYIIAKFFLGYEILEKGSGNIGMTNVIRTGGKIPGLITFFFDFTKGSAAVILFKVLNPESNEFFIFLAGFFAVFGHTRNIWLKFKGGKGIATHFGIWAVFEPTLFFIQALCWIAVFLFKKISSLAALTSLVVLIICSFFFFYRFEMIFFLILAEVIYLFLLHKENIQRLLKGEEKKLKAKSKSGSLDSDSVS